jgi:hypothetical protein
MMLPDGIVPVCLVPVALSLIYLGEVKNSRLAARTLRREAVPRTSEGGCLSTCRLSSSARLGYIGSMISQHRGPTEEGR